MPKLFKINAHSHILPYPEEIPSFMKEEKIFWIDEDRKFMHQGDWKRPITDESFFVKEKLEWMQKWGIDHCVVLTLSQLYGNDLNDEVRLKAIQFQNDFQGKLQNEYPVKFTSGFVVNPKNTKESIQEIKRCVEELNLSLLCLPTHYLNEKRNWKVLFNEETKPIFECANSYDLAIEIHPYDGEKFIQLEDQSWRFHLVWMLAQCADAYHFLTLNDFPNLFPNLRFCFAHGGMLAQANIGRRQTGFEGRPDLFPNQIAPKEYIGHKRIFFDSLLHDTLSLDLTIKRQGYQQIVAGLDDPYPLGEMEGFNSDVYPGWLLDTAKNENIISEKEFDAIWSSNTVHWLYGKDEKRIKDFKNRTQQK